MENQTTFALPTAVSFFIGTKKDGSKVSIRFDKKGEIQQYGATATGAPIESVRPLKAGRWEFFKGGIKKYLADQCNLTAITSADLVSTKEYRTAFEKAAYGGMLSDYRKQAIDNADTIVDEIATLRQSNTIQNRLLGGLQRELSKPAKPKKEKAAKPEVVGKDGLTSTQRKAATAAAAAAKAAYFASQNIGFENGKPILTTAAK
ncbi:hypothetical protein CLV58_12534 [Spirosoma oryzae]|uniref:Uncharacterized protein n=1 Tax=Spirosoma oryzae TaxID=1469603 RepID=A0A2T0S8P2_9BACT|nr:hypothetical protein [Spirosoma oryzae]PRY29772.1 hypothetical protein CLV58_12534 [Spirosoma oryzae]